MAMFKSFLYLQGKTTSHLLKRSSQYAHFVLGNSAMVPWHDDKLCFRTIVDLTSQRLQPLVQNVLLRCRGYLFGSDGFGQLPIDVLPIHRYLEFPGCNFQGFTALSALNNTTRWCWEEPPNKVHLGLTTAWLFSWGGPIQFTDSFLGCSTWSIIIQFVWNPRLKLAHWAPNKMTVELVSA